jgi:hypothetical protein
VGFEEAVGWRNERFTAQETSRGAGGRGLYCRLACAGLRSVEDVELVAVCDGRWRGRRRWREVWRGTRVFGRRFEEMLAAEKLDAVHVLVPPDRILRRRARCLRPA